MSYRTFKRVLGETNLERKCRWWFGISLAILLALSFTWYRQRTDEIIYDLNRMFLGPELVRAGWLELHFFKLVKSEGTGAQPGAGGNSAAEGRLSSDAQTEYWREFLKGSKEGGREFFWNALLPPQVIDDTVPDANRPKGDLELRLLQDWSQPRPQTVDPAEVAAEQEAGSPESYVQYVREGSTLWYQYYQPMYASQESCVQCHSQAFGVARWPNLKKGDLMAVIRVTTDHGPTAKVVAKTRAFLWVAAIVVGFVSMFSLWAVVRYVIVKPVKHLRDVSNAVRLGDVEQRAVIRTGDEFEELAAAFNRMLRQLLSQQSELRNVNDELDVRLDELAQANMRLYEMNRLKSDFLATVSHELRTPLNSILGFSDVLSGIDALDDKQKRYVGNIQRSGTMLLEMINDILDLAKMESGKMEVRLSEFRIGALVAAQCDMARPLAEKKNLELEHNISSGLPPLRQDQAKVQQILNNLLSNAIKFTPEGGRISISAERDELGDLRLTVTDTGIGISPDDQQLVFEKFRQAGGAQPDGDAMTREYSGTGLGLSIVRELCRLLGGDVSLESELGKGSKFTVRLPWRLEEVPRLDAQLREDLEALNRSVRAASHEVDGLEPELLKGLGAGI
jgi:signal transduction histidine kinase